MGLKYSLKSTTKEQFEKELMNIVMPTIDYLDMDEHTTDLKQECNCLDTCNPNTNTCDKEQGYTYSFERKYPNEAFNIRISRTRFKEQKRYGYKPFYEYKITCTYKNKERITCSLHFLESYDTTHLPKVASRYVSTRKINNRECRIV